MPTKDSTSCNAFTLIELLAVIVILGLLAALILPQFGYASDDARRNTAVAIVRTLRSQFELYRANYDAHPSIADGSSDWGFMTRVGTDPRDPSRRIGPYLSETPANPLVTVAKSRTIAVGDFASVDKPQGSYNAGFVFDSGTGRIWATNQDGSILP